MLRLNLHIAEHPPTYNSVYYSIFIELKLTDAICRVSSMRVETPGRFIVKENMPNIRVWYEWTNLHTRRPLSQRESVILTLSQLTEDFRLRFSLFSMHVCLSDALRFPRVREQSMSTSYSAVYSPGIGG